MQGNEPESPALQVDSLLLSQYIFATPWTAAQLASLSFTISQSLLKLMSIELVIDWEAWHTAVHGVTKSRA